MTHRVRWSILIGNLDGHTSELRCSLPLHVLDNRLYEEARAATLHTRRILLGPQDIEGGTALGTHGEEVEEDMDLPSYPSHVRDRVANAYLPDAAAMRVVNPWVMQGVSPTIIGPPRSEVSSGLQSPAAFETWQVAHTATANTQRHLPHEPPPGAAPLEWVNTELLLSLSREAPEMPVPVAPPPANMSPPVRTPPESASSHSPGGSRSHSRFPSRRPSRANSRAASPERGTTATAPSTVSTHSGDTFVHSGSHASRNMHSLFNIAMKPFTSLSNTFSLTSRSPSHSNLHAHGLAIHSHNSPSMPLTPAMHPVRNGTLSASASSVNLASLAHHPQPMTTPEQLHYAFTEVPDYDMANRGFLGGGITPLSSLQGLPSYDDAARERVLSQTERSFSDTDLAGLFAAAQRPGRVTRTMSRTAASTPPPPP